jgi:hypothetical protein
MALVGEPADVKNGGGTFTIPSFARAKFGFEPAAEVSYTSAALAAVQTAYAEVAQQAGKDGMTPDVVKSIHNIAMTYDRPEKKAVLDFGKAMLFPLVNDRWIEHNPMSTLAQSQLSKYFGANPNSWINRGKALGERERQLAAPASVANAWAPRLEIT